ncbi:MAG: class I SAM-dependent methyltransferase, partial [Chthoniobacterales bacterium]|nr:class I SAM-dependent methyltransferase [Chthoniobacterales bacterium]
MLTRLGQGGPVLDLGCGRGELAFQLAANGIPVTAIDYSPTAIEIAKGCFDEASAAAREKATFICGDATDLQLPTRFAVAIAGDLIEHLAPEELERLYASVADLLMPNGVFVIHTAPNVWRYTRSYPRRRREVRRLGGDMPAEPRTRYELLMHINEQSPTQLRRALRRYFPHVLVWVGTPRNPADHLTRRFSIGELAGASSIYALASHARIDAGEAAVALTSRPLPQGEHAKFRIALVECPDTVE